MDSLGALGRFAPETEVDLDERRGAALQIDGEAGTRELIDCPWPCAS
jgi:hypothetical protein